MAWEWYEHLIYPDWYMHNKEHDAVNAQASKTNSLEHRIDRLERELDAIQKSLPNLPDDERAQETQRAFVLMKQLSDLK